VLNFFGGERYQDPEAHHAHAGSPHRLRIGAPAPNMGECWEHGTATFMILGDICTRAPAAFVAVPSGKPVGPPDEEEAFPRGRGGGLDGSAVCRWSQA